MTKNQKIEILDVFWTKMMVFFENFVGFGAKNDVFGDFGTFEGAVRL